MCSGKNSDASGCTGCTLAKIRPGMCVSLSVRCESRELVPDYICYSKPHIISVDPPAREIKISADSPAYAPGDIPSDFSNTLQAPADSLVGTSIYPSIDTCINSPSHPAILLVAHSFIDSPLGTYGPNRLLTTRI